MGIPENKFGIIWRAIKFWMDKRGWLSSDLARFTGHSQYRIEKGITDGSEWITSVFVHACVEAFSLISARQRGPEDMTDILTDEECVAMLTAPLREDGTQGRFRI